MRAPHNNSGDRFGRWTLLNMAEDDRRKNHQWLCRCDCGVERVVKQSHLRDGSSRSCGCRGRRWIHGLSRTSEYLIWDGIKQRCLNPKDDSFHHYGGRGITICDEWRDSFPAFLAHIGPRPTPKHSIDRKDNSMGYEPGNVRWATQGDQMRNTRRNHLVEFRGETRSVTEWSEIIGINRGTLAGRLKCMPVEEAMSRPIGRWI